MQEINVKIWRNRRKQDWSAEINGKRYKSMAIESIEELVKRALIDAKESLTEAERRTQ
jgi:hypothetical protein